ncbi:HAD domain-containing protein [Massilia phyllosphaerae]|uniref:HAD domain-containing protein n=1 Tax=Massilia phyllosphaerae TaxID=3106034 RepID=UPI0035C9337A
MRPVVFLDFDDVLAFHPVHNGYRVLDAFANGTTDALPELWHEVFNAAARRNLQTLDFEYQPHYVISSSWASHLGRNQINEVLMRTGLEFVNSNLSEHWCTPRDTNSSRLSEIETWLKRYASTDALAFIILDDHMSGGALSGSWLEERTVFCDAWVGFTYAKLRTARKILKQPVRNVR